jgi:glycosyltransferase XagB
MGIEFSARRFAGDFSGIDQFGPATKFKDWPVVPEHWLFAAMPELDSEYAPLVVKHKIVPYRTAEQGIVFGVVTAQAWVTAKAMGLPVVGRVTPDTYAKLIRLFFSQRLLNKAVFSLRHSKPWASAHQRLSRAQTIAVSSFVAAILAASLLGSMPYVLTGLAFMGSLFFLLVVSLRLLSLMPLPKHARPPVLPVPDRELPVYTVLVPLFHETEVLQQALRALSLLDYPEQKLDIKIILEEEDFAMRSAVEKAALPPMFDIIIVPRGKPQTKPRALNYAIQFARGSLVTIFDGEDIPQPNQLRMAAAVFSNSRRNIACLQASLDFYNPNENWLTRQFTAEYAGLFRVILPMLAAYRLPLPLGGTSNHFRADALRAVGGWDPFNTTEDADLGIRLARAGFLSAILPSTTHEEANTLLGNWMKQRRRWLKGFLQTWLVHNRHPSRLLRECGLAGFITVQVMTIGVFASALLHPFLMAHIIWCFLPQQINQNTGGLVSAFSLGGGLVVLFAGYVSGIAVCAKGLARIGIFDWIGTFATIPVYWMISTISAWWALWDFAVAPFHWNKTRHGLSRVFKRGNS